MLASRPISIIVQLSEKDVTKENKEQRHDFYETGLKHYMLSVNVLKSEIETKRLYLNLPKQRCMPITKVEAQTSIVCSLSTSLTSLLQKLLDLISLNLLSSFSKQAGQITAFSSFLYLPSPNNSHLR